MRGEEQAEDGEEQAEKGVPPNPGAEDGEEEAPGEDVVLIALCLVILLLEEEAVSLWASRP